MLVLLAVSLILVNIAAWLWALASFSTVPTLIGSAALAYGLGLRHAVDADHIAAIDNVTRRLRESGQRPAAVGLFFSLGHSAVVFLATLGIVLTATAFQDRLEPIKAIGGVVGTLVSSSFLFLLAGLNVLILIDTARRLRRGPAADTPIAVDGPLARWLRPCFRLIRRSWHMLPLGFLFGLGFDTATEIGLLGLSAAEAARGLPLWTILVLPVLFASGMALVDTADGVLMLHAYDWAFVRPQRKLYYNLAITAGSVAMAVGVGGVELLGLIGDRFGLEGPVWNAVGVLEEHFGLIGYVAIALFAGLWLGAMGLAWFRDTRSPAPR